MCRCYFCSLLCPLLLWDADREKVSRKVFEKCAEMHFLRAAFLSSFCLFVVTFKVKKVMYFLVLLWIVGMPPNLLIPSLSYFCFPKGRGRTRRRRRQYYGQYQRCTLGKKTEHQLRNFSFKSSNVPAPSKSAAGSTLKRASASCTYARITHVWSRHTYEMTKRGGFSPCMMPREFTLCKNTIFCWKLCWKIRVKNSKHSVVPKISLFELLIWL